MTTTSLWKGLALLAMILLISSEAFAQLPVRTQKLQMLGTASGTATFDTPAAITSYTVTWPADANVFAAAADTAILMGVYGGAPGSTDLEWRLLSGSLVDGNGSTGFVAWWTDDNTLTYTNNFAWSGTALNIGTQANVAAGSLNLGDGGAVPATNVAADGSSGTLTLGSAANDGTIVMNDGSGQTVTITSGAQTAGYNVNFDDAPAGTYTVTPSTNAAGAATNNYIYVSNGDGTASWIQNPSANLKAGVVVPAANAYSAVVAFTNVYPDPDGAGPLTAPIPAVTVSAVGPVANGYVLQVTGVTSGGFTILSSAPFDGTDGISWIANAPADNP